MFCRHDKYLQVVAHLYRAEMNRLTIYRQRLDTISNWCMTIVGAVFVIYLSNATISPHIIHLFTLPTLLFSFIEARRYRYYLISQYRIHCLEKGFYALEILEEGVFETLHYRSDLIQSLSRPTYTISLFYAWCIRFFRNYIWVVYFLVISWYVKLHIMDYEIIYEFVYFSTIMILLCASHAFFAMKYDSTIDI